MSGIGLLWRLTLVIVIAASFGCAVNPVTGKNEIAFVPESQELAIGKTNYGPYRQAQGGDYVVDSALTRYVQSVGDRIARVSDRKLPYEFKVLNDSSPNAWALPGGKIAINRGLLVELESEAELAAVLAHEIVHAAARHSAQSMERGVFLQGALAAAGVALGGSDFRDIGMLGANMGAQLTNQKFGRDDETEADLFGMRYMARAGYDPAAAVRLQETFVRLAEGNEPGWLEGLFASHPPSRARVESNRRMLAEMGSIGGEVGKADYQRAIARIKRAQPAYEAYEEAKKALKEGDLRTAGVKIDRAIAIEPDEAIFFSLRGEIKAARDNKPAALRDLDRAIALNPDYFRPLLVRGLVRRDQGDSTGAVRDLERSVALLPTAEGYFGLGLAAQDSGRHDEAVAHYRRAASSHSEAGKRAGQRLARIELPQNPSRYVAADLRLSQDGYLVVEVSNKSPVPVQDLRVVVGARTPGGIRPQESFRVDRRLSAGQAVRVKTRLGPMNATTARRYAAVVDDARIVE